MNRELVTIAWLKEQTPEFRKKWLAKFNRAKNPIKRDLIESLGFPWPPPRGWAQAFAQDKPLHQVAQERPLRATKKQRRAEKKKKQRERRVKKDDFLHSYEWRRLRYLALKTYGNKCMACGRGPEQGAVINVDHIKCRKKHPSLALVLSNLQILCGPCNHGKGNWDSTDWRP